jgi:hypothetical protein
MLFSSKVGLPQALTHSSSSMELLTVSLVQPLSKLPSIDNKELVVVFFFVVVGSGENRQKKKSYVALFPLNT